MKRRLGWRRPSRLLIGLLLLWALLQTMGTTIAVTHMWWPALAKTVIGAELLLIMVTWLWRQRTHRPRPLTRTLATLAFINAFGFIPLCAYFWQPPSVESAKTQPRAMESSGSALNHWPTTSPIPMRSSISRRRIWWQRP